MQLKIKHTTTNELYPQFTTHYSIIGIIQILMRMILEWIGLLREKVDSIMVSQINYENECG